MQLITRELNFDKFEYTWEEKLEAVKQEIQLTAQEEKEIRDAGIVLCPATFREFFSSLRAAEKKVAKESEELELKNLRKRNVILEGKRLLLEKEIRRQPQYP